MMNYTTLSGTIYNNSKFIIPLPTVDYAAITALYFNIDGHYHKLNPNYSPRDVLPFVNLDGYLCCAMTVSSNSSREFRMFPLRSFPILGWYRYDLELGACIVRVRLAFFSGRLLTP